MKLSDMFGHAVKHGAMHALWMLPMAMIMMPSPALASGLVGSLDMMLTNGFNFFADGGFSTLVENTLNGNFWEEGYSPFDGSMDMSGHAEHLSVPEGGPDLSADALELLK